MVLNSDWRICGLGLIGLGQDSDQDYKFSSLSSSPCIHGPCMVQQDQDIWHGLKGQDHILVLDSGVYWLILTWTQQSSCLVCHFREFRVCNLHIFNGNHPAIWVVFFSTSHDWSHCTSFCMVQWEVGLHLWQTAAHIGDWLVLEGRRYPCILRTSLPCFDKPGCGSQVAEFLSSRGISHSPEWLVGPRSCWELEASSDQTGYHSKYSPSKVGTGCKSSRNWKTKRNFLYELPVHWVCRLPRPFHILGP